MTKRGRRAALLAALVLALGTPGCSSSRDHIGVGGPGWSLGTDGDELRDRDRRERREKHGKKAKAKKQNKGKDKARGKAKRGGA